VVALYYIISVLFFQCRSYTSVHRQEFVSFKREYFIYFSFLLFLTAKFCIAIVLETPNESNSSMASKNAVSYAIWPAVSYMRSLRSRSFHRDPEERQHSTHTRITSSYKPASSTLSPKNSCSTIRRISKCQKLQKLQCMKGQRSSEFFCLKSLCLILELDIRVYNRHN
jgi:hypothetical protein